MHVSQQNKYLKPSYFVLRLGNLRTSKNQTDCDDCWPMCLFFSLSFVFLVILLDLFPHLRVCLFVWLFVCLIVWLVCRFACLFLSLFASFLILYHLGLDNSSMTSNQFSKLWHLSTMMATWMNEGFGEIPIFTNRPFYQHQQQLSFNQPTPKWNPRNVWLFLAITIGHRCHLVIWLTNHFRYLKWRNPHLYKLYGYGLCKGKPTPKNSRTMPVLQETLHFRYLQHFWSSAPASWRWWYWLLWREFLHPSPMLPTRRAVLWRHRAPHRSDRVQNVDQPWQRPQV